MSELSWDNIKNNLEQIGLNIFLSISVKKLPDEIVQNLKNDGIEINDFSSLVLIGNGGSRFWQNFAVTDLRVDHPIDNFCLKTIRDVRSDVLILYPSNIFLPPLQKLGRLFNLSHPSPLGIDISNQFGPWFAFRLLFLTKEIVPEFQYEYANSPCKNCLSLDCIKTCPANAVTQNGLDLFKCLEYRKKINSKCSNQCLSRISCPQKKEHQYTPDQINYHYSSKFELF